MKIVLLTGIYPPDIGGPALYVKQLAERLSQAGETVTVITYGRPPKVGDTSVPYSLVHIAKWGGPLLRWWRYARAIKAHASDAHIVYAFSSVSCGVPLLLARLKTPKKILRLGGDFFWERYTDRGGMLGLREWYASKDHTWMARILKRFHHIVFSTEFQQKIYEEHYTELPPHSVIENAVPQGTPIHHEKHKKFQLLYMGRFVGFKNLSLLIRALHHMDGVHLTFIGSGPLKGRIKMLRRKYKLRRQISLKKPVHDEEKLKAFADYDLLVLPSITEISPNVALEAHAAGLPVLLTQETGLSAELKQGMIVTDLSSEGKITGAVVDAIERYESIAEQAAKPLPKRDWDMLTEEHLSLFRSLV